MKNILFTIAVVLFAVNAWADSVLDYPRDTAPGNDSAVYCIDDADGTPLDRRCFLSDLARGLLNSGTIAALPAAPYTGQEYYATDGSTSSDCTVGGGANKVKCIYNGAAWVALGGSEINNLETIATGIADDEIPLGNGASSLVYTAIPNCTDEAETLGYDAATNAFECNVDAGAGGGMTSWTAQADDTNTMTITDGETVDIAGGAGLNTTAATGAPEQLTVNLTVGDNEATAEANAITFVANADLDGSTDALLESDGDLTYNPSTGTVTATVFAGNLTGNVTGNASTASALAANGGNCNAGEIPLGVDTAGAVEGCYEPSEADISDLNHTATAITDGIIVEADLSEDSGTPTDEDVLTYDSTGANFNWVAQSTLAAGTAAALAANGGNCAAGQVPLGVDTAGAVESCFDVWTEAENTAAAYLTTETNALESDGASGIASGELFVGNGAGTGTYKTLGDTEIPDAHSHAADAIDTITEIAAALKSGADTTLITGTAGGSGNCAEFNADGDLVEAVSGAPCGSGGSGDNVAVNGTGADTTANFIDGLYGDWTLTDGGAGGPDTIAFIHNYGITLAGNPALNVDECVIGADTSGGFILCEGSTADTAEQIYRFPNLNGSDTTEYFAILSALPGSDNTYCQADGTTGKINCTIAFNAGTDPTADLEEEVTEGSLADQTIITDDIKEGTILSGDLSWDAALTDGDFVTYDSTGTNFNPLSAAEVLTVLGGVANDFDGNGDVTIVAADISNASANGQSLITAADYAAMRALLDLEAGTDFYSIAAADTAHEAELDNSAGLASALSDETGTGLAVFNDSPTLAGIVTLPIAATPTTDADGEISFDTDGWAAGYDALEIFNGTASAYVVATTASDIPTNGQVPKWNTGGEITWEDDSTGSGSLGTNLTSSTDDITSDNGTIRLATSGGTNNEDLDFDFETVANTVGVSSSTGVTLIDTGSIGIDVAGFTSTGIDDNATGERLQMGDALISFGVSGSNYTLAHIGQDSRLILSGGNGPTDGATIDLFGSTHATTANDINLKSNSNTFAKWDESVGSLAVNTGTGIKTLALTLDSSQNATFAGDVSAVTYSGTGVSTLIADPGVDTKVASEQAVREEFDTHEGAADPHTGYVLESAFCPNSTTNSKATAYTIGTDDACECDGGTIYVTSAATITACDGLTDGMNFEVITIGAIAVSLDTQSDDKMYLDGTLLDDGDKATNVSTSGDFIKCTYYSVDGWFCSSGSTADPYVWSDGGA